MPPSLRIRFLDNLRRLGIGDAPAHLLVAVSGGRDSTVLLHLLRFAARSLPLTLTAAHLDHAMREGSERDARWVAGVCAAWGVPLVRQRLEEPPRSEAEARRARYRFLRCAATGARAQWVVTAHHADDQAETVLFRVLRGTGLRGLRGIPPRTRSGLVRPLLPFWGEELEDYAREAGLRWRTDPTNLVPDAARNRIRLRLLPEIEREIAPGARRSLVALAELASQAEADLALRAAPVEGALVRFEEGAAVLARAMVRDYDSTLGARILRKLLRRFGIVLDRTGTRTALQFITDAPSGREMQLPSGVRIRLEFDEARIERDVAPPPDLAVAIPDPASVAPARAVARIGGRDWRVEWVMGKGEAGDEAGDGGWRIALDLRSLRFPLRLRGRAPGDRIRTPGGTKTLKKLFVERRVARGARARVPLVVDAQGAVLWAGGVGRAVGAEPRPGGETLFLTVSNVRFQADPGADGGA